MTFPTLELERQHSGIVAGVDEAGRGPWAGPVVAAAVILPNDNSLLESGIHDSKKLSARKRESLFEVIKNTCQVGVGKASEQEIDQYNILAATKLAMKRAVEALTPAQPDVILVDGNQRFEGHQKIIPVIRGDSLSLSIAAASIIAKVTRDAIMTEYHEEFPYYGWDSNAGYGTKQHQDGLQEHGVTPYHRRSFAPIRALLENTSHG